MTTFNKPEQRYLAGIVAALAVSVLVVFASLGHAVTATAAFA
jgi:hypothetical protein